jgi:putative solute:sodium symporter small subunit
MTQVEDRTTENRSLHWRRVRRLTALLLVFWLAASFGVALFARELGFSLFAAPFSVWVAGQGALIAFLGIVWIDVWVSARIERGNEQPMKDSG